MIFSPVKSSTIKSEDHLATLNNLPKPKILTESDRIFSDLSAELAQLKNRMNQLEQEQDDSRSLIDQISLQEELASKLINNQQKEITGQKENFQVLAGVMHNLKTPVNRVMENLASIITEIDDKDTQDSLKDCIDTASTVLDGFNEVEEFCLFESKEFLASQKTVNLRAFFTELVSKFQLNPLMGNKHSLKLKISSDIPEQTAIYGETLENAIHSILEELAIAAEPGVLELSVQIQSGGTADAVDFTDLVVNLEIQGGTHLSAQDSWVDFVKTNGPRLKQSGFSLLKVRDRIRQTGGQLDMVEEAGQLQGYQFTVPLTY